MNTYQQRYAYPTRYINDAIDHAVSQIVVIPCFKETALIQTLNALHRCTPTQGMTEVIVVINESESADSEATAINRQCLAEAQKWAQENPLSWLKFHFVYVNDLPRKHAGVGLARKIGMDEAAWRLEQINKPKAPIICFDADSQCSENYLQEIENYFSRFPKTKGASIHFEHPLSGDFPKEWYEAIEIYELHLRYYVNGLRYANFPFAYETIGSSMVVRADIYQKQGGMNRRKAGEDFYFLHKIIPHGDFADITDCMVIPSPRPSDRVPFGTGKAVGDFLASGETQSMVSYNPAIFTILKAFIHQAADFYRKPYEEVIQQLDDDSVAFLEHLNFKEDLQKILKNSPNANIYKQRFFQWFDGFRCLKYVHFLRDQRAYKNIDLREGAHELAQTFKMSPDTKANLLHLFREWDKKSYYLPDLSSWE